MPYSQTAQALGKKLRYDYGVTVEGAAIVLTALADHVKANWERGEGTYLPGIGNLRPKYSKPRTVKPGLQTIHGAEYRIPLRKSMHLEPAPALREDYGSPVEKVGETDREREGKRMRERYGDW